MVSPTNFPPPADNPDRAPIQGAGNDYVVSLIGDNSKFLRSDGVWALPPGGGGGSVWGGITGTLSNQTDLQNALNLKANTSSLATVATSGAYNDLSGKPTLGTLAGLSYPGGTSAFLRADGTWQIPVDVLATWGNISGTLSSQTDLNTALGLKAPLASPSLTGVPTAPTAAQDTNTLQLATTAYVLAQLGSSNPLINGTASSGASLRMSRQDHVHPTDTSRMSNTVMTTAGDIIVGGVSGAPGRLAIGSNAQVLTVSGGNVVWAAAPGGLTNPMTTAEDLIKGGASGTPTRLGVGGNGTFLGVVGGVITWTTPSGSGDFVGPGSSVSGNLVSFGNTTGKLGADSGVAAANVATMAANGTSGNLISSAGANKTQQDAGIAAANVATMAAAAAASGRIITSAGVNKTLQDSGTLLSALAPLASPTFTGTPLSTTAAADTNTTQVATTAFVIGQVSTSTPLIESGAGAIGTSLKYARADHVHPAAGGSGDVVGPASATADSVAIFNGTTGKLLKDSGPLYTNLATMAANAAASGRVITSAGADKTQQDSGTLLSALATTAAVAATYAPLASPALTGNPTAPTAATGDNDTSIATTAFVQQEKIIALTSRSADYTLVAADANCGTLHPSADTTARTMTIPANSSVAFPVGTTHTFVNQNGAGTMTIAITTDTMRLAGAGTTGSRTLAANGIATALKITSTEWIINGTGLT